MKNKEIIKKTFSIWKNNIGLIAFIGLITAIFQSVVSVTSIITFEAMDSNLSIGLLSFFITAPLTICTYNIFSLLIRGNLKVKKSYLFEWLGDFKLVWHSVKTQIMFGIKMLPWLFLFSFLGGFLSFGLADLSQSLNLSDKMFLTLNIVILIICTLLILYEALRYLGGVFECSAIPTKIITPTFYIGMIKMKYNLKDFCLLMLCYLPFFLLFSAPVFVYGFMIEEYDIVYFLLMALETVGTNLIITPLIGISGMMRYNVGAKIPPEAFFKSFGMTVPKEYSGKNIPNGGTAEKPDIMQNENADNPNETPEPDETSNENQDEKENDDETK